MKKIGLSLALLFVVLKKRNEQQFTRLFPGASQLKMILRNMMEQEPGNDSISIKAANAIFETITDSVLYTGYQKEFNRVMDSAALAGVNWDDARYVYHTADTTASTEVGGDMLSGLIIFTSGSKEYFIRYDGVIWFKNVDGWLGITVKQVGEMRYPD
jgi:hypothetical protein